jgi:glutaredoxin 2
MNNIREVIEEYDNKDIKHFNFDELINLINNLNLLYNQRLLKFSIINNKIVILFNDYYKKNFFYKDYDKIKLRYEYLKNTTKRIIKRILKKLEKFNAYIILTSYYNDYFMNDTITPIFINLLNTQNISNFLYN